MNNLDRLAKVLRGAVHYSAFEPHTTATLHWWLPMDCPPGEIAEGLYPVVRGYYDGVSRVDRLELPTGEIRRFPFEEDYEPVDLFPERHLVATAIDHRGYPVVHGLRPVPGSWTDTEAEPLLERGIPLSLVLADDV